MSRSLSQQRHHYRRRDVAADDGSHSCSTKRYTSKRSLHGNDYLRSRSRGSMFRRRSSRDARRSSIDDDKVLPSSDDRRRETGQYRSTDYHSPTSRRYNGHGDISDFSSTSQSGYLQSRGRRHRERRSFSAPHDDIDRNRKQEETRFRSSKRRRSPSERRASYRNKYSSVGKQNNKSLSRDRQRRSSSRRSCLRSPSVASKRSTQNHEKSHASPVKHCTRRAWKFDSPPREDGLEEGPQQQSPMGLLAQSLGLSAEQQKASRELYIGNLPPALDVNQLIDFFNAAMLTLKASSIPGNPVSRAWIASDGHFAFVEFRTIEEATIGLQLNGLNCMGYALRIGRPKTYPSEFSTLLGCTNIERLSAPISCLTSSVSHLSTNPTSAILAAQAAATSIGFTKRIIETRPDRLVMLDLPSQLCTEEKIKTILSSFGELNIFQYFEVPETAERAATGVCVFEYKDHASQKEMDSRIGEHSIGSTQLSYVLADDAIRDGKLSEVMTQAAQAGRDLQQELGGELMRPQVPTRVIMLTNIVTREELLDDKEYADIVEDVFIECSHYGKVVSVEIPRPSCVTNETLDPLAKMIEDSDIGYAFVKFARLQGAGAARRRLSGRKFAGRTVEAHYYSEILFKEKHFKSPQPNYDTASRLLDSPTANASYGDVVDSGDGSGDSMDNATGNEADVGFQSNCSFDR